jgi:fructose-bisphosphate aldolase, class II
MIEEATVQAHPALGSAVSRSNGTVTVHDPAALAGPGMDALVRDAVFGTGESRDQARWLIWEIGQAVGVRPSSIHDLYLARGRGAVGGFTVPAINVRGMAYETARSIFRVANKLDAGAFILEIARSEIAYTDQRPAEYVAVMLAAALREGFRGPVFIQGDHFQVNAKKYAVDRDPEVNAVKSLAREAIDAGFYNIDVDTSTLVDLSKPTLTEQQRRNFEECVDITQYLRSLEPQGVTISVGFQSAGRSVRSGPRTARSRNSRHSWRGSTRHCTSGRPVWRASRRSAFSPARRTGAWCLPMALLPT